MNNKIEISTTDDQDRRWTIVSHPSAVGFTYTVTLEGREVAQGWTEQEHTALRVGRVLHFLVDLDYERLLELEGDGDHVDEATSGPCPVCGCRWSGSVDSIAEKQECFDHYVADGQARLHVIDQWYADGAISSLIPTTVVGPDGCTREADRLWVSCPLCGGESPTGIALLDDRLADESEATP